MASATIIYYSSCREDPAFEQRVRDNILAARGDLRIISVTQKPLPDFGHNICVGDVGVSGFNCFRQIQIATEAATTEFVISAEADCLYPPDYFAWLPPRRNRVYRNANLYVMPDQRDYYYLKQEGATHAQVVGREYYLRVLGTLFEGAPLWSPGEKNFPKERWRKEDIVDTAKHYRTENPVVQIKTHRGLRYYTRSDRTPIPTIPYWGDGRKVRAFYLRGKVLPV